MPRNQEPRNNNGQGDVRGSNGNGLPASQPVYYGPAPSVYGGYVQYGGEQDRWFSEDSFLKDLAEFARILWVKKWIVLLVLCFGLACWAYYILSATPIYRAESILELSVRRPRISGQQDAVITDDSGRLASAELFNTQIHKIQSNMLRKKVIEKSRKYFPLLKNEDRKISEYFEKNVNIDMIRRSSLVKISVKSPSPEHAAAIANLYASEAVEMVYAINRDTSRSAVAWLESQIEAQGKLLGECEKKLLEYKKKNLLETLEAQRSAIKEAMIAYSKELTEASAARDKLLSRYTKSHPEVKTQDQLISAIKMQYDEQVDSARQIEQEIARVRTESGAIEREKETVELTYKGIFARMEEARLSADEKTATIKIVEPADEPVHPVSPRKMLSLALALVLGGLGGAFLGMLSYKLEDRVWGNADVENDMGLRVLGNVPHLVTTSRAPLALISLKDKFSVAAESFSGIRGVLDTNSESKTFLVTSSEPGEGKTICSCNLAIMSAKSGMRVLLVDLDMRRPRLARIWRDNIPGVASPENSLLHALCDVETSSFDDIHAKTELPTLDVIISQVAMDINPAEVLGSQRIRDFLSWAAKTYDRVIIDSPPLGAASDAMVLGGLVDSVILVFRFNKTKKSIAKRSVRRLKDTDASIMGVIINDVDFSKSGFEYGHYYASGSHEHD